MYSKCFIILVLEAEVNNTYIYLLLPADSYAVVVRCKRKIEDKVTHCVFSFKLES